MRVELINSLLSSVLNIVLFVLIPFSIYYARQRWKYGTGLKELCARAGLVIGPTRYLVYSLVVTMSAVVLIALLPPDIKGLTHGKSAQNAFVGLGVSGLSLSMAAIYGFLKTGFCEEFFFRGLIAGAFARRMSLWWANLCQALIFLLPHLLIIWFAPQLWYLLIAVFVGALFAGWVRIRSGSILGPALLHGSMNFTTCMVVAVQTTL
jgi:membrane protease YdiL (CAAX protease family)